MADDSFPFRDADMDDNRSSDGGQVPVKPLPYSPPQGPIGLNHTGPGLGGANHGPSGGQQGRH